ncbi:MAG TPA: carbohydrate binding domain-containing protein [Galbitalea sp.]|jgi:hypothetical protein
MNKMLSRLTAIALATALATTAIVALENQTAEPATAATTSAFDPGFIISDGVFFDGGAMTAASISSFIAGKEASCATTSTAKCLKSYSATTITRPADAYCKSVPGGTSLSAATIIARVAVACNVSPKVLLVTLQKEQGLVTGAGDSRAFNYAMGWGCPDSSSGCAGPAAGFAYQIYKSAWQFQVYRISGFGSYQAGRENYIPYQTASVSSCGGSNVFIRNEATAGLYNYTPYQPNAAALAAGSGRGDRCSSYGNRNFFNYFSAWFGNPANRLVNQGFESGTKGWAAGSHGGITYSSYASAAYAYEGSHYLRMKASKPGALVKQTISYTTQLHGTYTAGVWLKSTTASPITGHLQLWAEGGTQEISVLPFTVGSTWTYFSTDLVVKHSGHSKIVFIVDLDTVGQYLRVDNAEFFFAGIPAPVQQPMVGNGLSNPGFQEPSSSLVWTAGDDGGVAENIYSSSAYARTGSRYLRAIASSAGARVKQTVVFNSVAGESYTASLWVRAATGAVNGQLLLYAGGGTTQSATKSFVAGSTWRQVSVALPITSAHTDLRFVIQLDTPGLWLRADDAYLSLSPQPTPSSPPTGANVSITNAGFEGTNGAPGWAKGTAAGISYSAYAKAAYSHSGSKYLRVIATKSGALVKQTTSFAFVKGHVYTGGVWVRAATAGTHVSGKLAIWAAGGTMETATTPFSVGDTWTWVGVALKPALTGHSQLRFILEDDTPDQYIRFDDAQFVPNS